MGKKTILQMKEITMCFPGVKALDEVNLELHENEVLGLIGENGAGKSTLMNVLLGSYIPTSGTMEFFTQPYSPKAPQEALKAGISMIHQEISLVPTMTVAENIWLGRESMFSKAGILDVRKREAATKTLLEKLDIQIDPNAVVNSLPIAAMQLTEVVRAVSYNSKVIIMDEPTSALTQIEVEKLYAIIRNLVKAGTSVIYISHKLQELFDICDRVTVMRDGKNVATCDIEVLNEEKLVNMMVGRELSNLYPKVQVPFGKTVFRCEKICRKGSFSDVSFSVRAGEILGFCGLMGAQRTEIMQAVFGIDEIDSGKMWLYDKEIHNRSTRDGIRNRFAMVTEDRLHTGAIHMLSVKENTSIAYLRKICKAGFIDRKREQRDCDDISKRLRTKISSVMQPVSSLSGGNQQKVIIGKWLLTKPEVLILDEPTRGIDVGAKAEIYRLIGELAQQGKAILMISSDLPELMGISDRIMVVREGRIVAEKGREEFDQDRLMSYAFGIQE